MYIDFFPPCCPNFFFLLKIRTNLFSQQSNSITNPCFFIIFSLLGAVKKHTADLQQRNADLNHKFTVGSFDRHVSDWLKDADKRLQNEVKRRIKEAEYRARTASMNWWKCYIFTKPSLWFCSGFSSNFFLWYFVNCSYIAWSSLCCWKAYSPFSSSSYSIHAGVSLYWVYFSVCFDMALLTVLTQYHSSLIVPYQNRRKITQYEETAAWML